jgi:murein DD-endopeptidase MepM/ murein hydrolase activator NlpD
MPVMRWMLRVVLVAMAISGLVLGNVRRASARRLPADAAGSPAPYLSAQSNGDGGLKPGQHILIPVVGIERAALRPSFDEGRVGHVHHAIDILAPRGTPVVAAVDGRIQKLFVSAGGGLTIYEFDRAGELVYYYAHLDRYEPSLVEGMDVTQGTVIGYVGTTGNAPANTPHLHFAIERLGPEKLWWRGEAIDPYPILMAQGESVTRPASTPLARLSDSH